MNISVQFLEWMFLGLHLDPSPLRGCPRQSVDGRAHPRVWHRRLQSLDDLRDEGVGDARTRSLGELEGVAQLLNRVGAATAVSSVELKAMFRVRNSNHM